MVSDAVLALIGTLITAAVSILVVGLSYVSSKNREINAEIRQKKQGLYDGLVVTLNAVIQSLWEGKTDIDAFILANNRANAYSSDEVVDALDAFFTLLIQKETDNSKITDSINEIYHAIRKDLNPKAESFKNQVFRAEPTSPEEQERQRQQQQSKPGS